MMEKNNERWTRLSAASIELGIPVVRLRKWANGFGECQPPMPSTRVRGCIYVQPRIAYEHIKRHAKTKQDRDIQDPDQSSFPSVPLTSRVTSGLKDAGVDVPTEDPKGISLKDLLDDPNKIPTLGTDVVRAIVAVESEKRKQDTEALRRAELFSADEVVSELTAIFSQFVDHLDKNGVEKIVSAICVSLSKYTGIKMRDHSALPSVLEKDVRDGINESLADARRGLEASIGKANTRALVKGKGTTNG